MMSSLGLSVLGVLTTPRDWLPPRNMEYLSLTERKEVSYRERGTSTWLPALS